MPDQPSKPKQAAPNAPKSGQIAPKRPKNAPKRRPSAKNRTERPVGGSGAPGEEKRSERDVYPERLRPPERVKEQWKRRSKAIGDRGYVQRWSAFWKRAILALQEQKTWREHDIVLVAEYVKRCRLVELHGDLAELAPYGTSETGVVRAHPGFERALAEAREARAIAVELKLTPRARENAGIQIPDVPGPDDPVVKPDGVEWADDQLGANGRPL